MRNGILTLCVLVLVLTAFTGSRASAGTYGPVDRLGAAGAGGSGDVKVVLFWMQGCGHCKQVMTEVLPPLQARYGNKLTVKTIEVSDAESSARFDRVLSALGLTSSDAGVPFLLIGDRYLMGSLQIPAELPALVEQYAASGGVDYPALPGLENLATYRQTSTAGGTFSGFELAWVVMAVLVLSIAYALWTAARTRRGGRPVASPPWLWLAVPLLCAAGIVVALYLSYVETTATSAVCGPVGDCNAVQSSPYARLFGILPIGVLGLLGYLAILVAWAVARWGKERPAQLALLAMGGMALFGVVFSIYLTALELYVIRAVCLWCLTSAVIMALLLGVAAVAVAPVLRRRPAPVAVRRAPVVPAAQTAPRQRARRAKRRR